MAPIIVESLEQELKKPVLGGPGVVVWHALRIAGIQTSLHGLGQLLENY